MCVCVCAWRQLNHLSEKRQTMELWNQVHTHIPETRIKQNGIKAAKNRILMLKVFLAHTHTDREIEIHTTTNTISTLSFRHFQRIGCFIIFG